MFCSVSIGQVCISLLMVLNFVSFISNFEFVDLLSSQFSMRFYFCNFSSTSKHVSEVFYNGLDGNLIDPQFICSIKCKARSKVDLDHLACWFWLLKICRRKMLSFIFKKYMNFLSIISLIPYQKIRANFINLNCPVLEKKLLRRWLYFEVFVNLYRK